MFWHWVGKRFGFGLVGVERHGRWFAKHYISIDYKIIPFAFAVIAERVISTGETGIPPTLPNRFTTGGKQPKIRGRGVRNMQYFPKEKGPSEKD